MSEHGHFIEWYPCRRHVRTQCRCADPAKQVRVSTEPCPECPRHQPFMVGDRVKWGHPALAVQRTGTVAMLDITRHVAVVNFDGDQEGMAVFWMDLSILPPGPGLAPQQQCLLCGKPEPGRWNGQHWVCLACGWLETGSPHAPGEPTESGVELSDSEQSGLAEELCTPEPAVHADCPCGTETATLAIVEELAGGAQAQECPAAHAAHPEEPVRHVATAKLTVKCGEGYLLECALETPAPVSRLSARLLGGALVEAMAKVIDDWRA